MNKFYALMLVWLFVGTILFALTIAVSTDHTWWLLSLPLFFVAMFCAAMSAWNLQRSKGYDGF
jgi:formate hydrogenlyase subunit 4